MKKFFILLIVVLMLAGLTFTSFANQNGNVEEPPNCVEDCDGPIRDRSGWQE